MTTDTPETDSHYYPDFEMGGDVVLAAFARKLERERDEARERIKNNPWCEACLETDCCVSGDGTCAMIRKYLSEKSAEVKLTAVTKERDEARAEMIRWMSIAEGRGRTDETLSNQ